MKNAISIATAMVCALAVPVSAQAPAPARPKVLQIFREVVKPGHGPAHAKTEAGWPAAFAKHGSPTHYLALVSQTGPTEAWFVTAYDSFAAWEKDVKANEANAALQGELDRLSAADGDHLSAGFGILGTLADDLSYGAAFPMSKARYVSITTYRIKPGRTADFIAARKIANAAHEKAKLDERWGMYRVNSGMPGQAFVLVSAMGSMADLDANDAMHGKAYQDALGEENSKKMGDLMASSVETITTNIYAVSPQMSYPPKEWQAADPFWAPKTERAVASAATGKLPDKSKP
ncbi:MAG TPA: NIPSNAP family protein [Vicinamibacteria bacterium]|nr:NIPSNAP family protein [Vicinamibacteria bacterium]